MKQLIARKPLLIAVVSLSALCGGCARDVAPPRTAVVEGAAQPIPSPRRAMRYSGMRCWRTALQSTCRSRTAG
jgi:hypothetical protein